MYRCTSIDGVLGKAYPFRFPECMNSLVSSSDEDVAFRYGLSHMLRVKLLKSRAAEMLKHGFEGTIKVRSGRLGHALLVINKFDCLSL